MIEEMKRWKQNFCQKFWVENFFYISEASKIDPQSLSGIIFWRSLFSEKRLIFIDNILQDESLSETILSHIDETPEDTILVIMVENPDKRKSHYKKLAKTATLKEFISENEGIIFQTLQSRYTSKINSEALKYLITLKWGNIEKCIGEIEKLLILYPTIEKHHVETYITAEYEESIFVFIDALIAKNPKKIFSDFQTLLNHSNIYSLYHSILANLRVFLYISFLQSKGKSQQEISQILNLWNRAFLINKPRKANFNEIQILFQELLRIDGNMKSGKLPFSQEQDFCKSMEQVFIEYLS